MPAFAFSLQRVLDYRRLEEGWAQDTHRDAREAREEAEAVVAAIQGRRHVATDHGAPTLAARLDLETFLAALQLEEATAQARVAKLEADEDRAADEWRMARAAAEALEKLREKALEAWRQDEARREQMELDEWAVMRR